MPRRTNDFQSLITLLHRQLAAPDTVVTESALIADPITGQLREVDILIEHLVARYRARIILECRDRSRAATVQWIDELAGKYQNSGAKIVAVSRRGFTKTALQRATGAGIEAVSVSKAVNRDWLAWVTGLPAVKIELVRVDLVRIELILAPELRSESLPAPSPDARLRLSQESEWTTPRQLYDALRQNPRLSQVLDSRPNDEAGLRTVTIGLPPTSQLDVGDDRIVHPDGLRYYWRVTPEVVEIAMQPLRVGDQDVAMGTAVGTDWKAHLVWSYAPDGTPRSSLSFAPGTPIGPGRTVIVGSDPVTPFQPAITDRINETAPEPIARRSGRPRRSSGKARQVKAPARGRRTKR